MQSAVDYESKMIVSVDINNKPTDHTQLEKQIENVENTIEETPQVISADNGYHTNENINSIQNKDIDLLIPTRKQNKEHNHKLNHIHFIKTISSITLKQTHIPVPKVKNYTIKTHIK